ncbi:hypothetical protein G3I40_12450 [Streptomyces sp. SID14478]|uniref:hypothetical protein n=1 Tax=Streptomyces sp. SID14478 TaxID=2706073 RepID=UPI0013DA2B30|nr:hypothetical protein [Streptomyces sp. SID14478]NEB76026.1 hypothetical protein [Streptomyces sp. SID14478]
MTRQPPDPEVRPETPGKRPPAVPRDLPDQQAGAHEEDPLDVQGHPEEGQTQPDEAEPDHRGDPPPGGSKTDHPVPDEPSA